ncbi:MAG TPA: exodeoxyribonuclease III [bacterium]|nr:exodeoxyribonuclease III [bacterium]HPT29739.1 exodeoxyribonuclease III [bacterium]
MKIISWNVNGIRANLRQGALPLLLSQEKPAVVCLQETKISEKKLAAEKINFPGYQVFFHSAKREGYSGTALLISDKLKTDKVKVGIGLEKFDAEGRIQILELPKAYLCNVYFPNSNHELSRLSYKQEFNEALLQYIKKLDKKKPVIVTGDFNVAHQPIDLARPKQNEGNAGYTKEEREFMTRFLSQGFVDSFRFKNPQKIQYSWWSFRSAARLRNIGWRIDYFVVSDRIKKLIKKAYILDKITGSDHAPVVLEID